MTKKNAANKQLRLTQIRSSAKRLQSHKACLKGLGLRRMRHTVEVTATPEVLGMVRKIGYLLQVQEIS
ncbi:MAG: 50S ribosomal protein L30 [Nevskiales bacterium]